MVDDKDLNGGDRLHPGPESPGGAGEPAAPSRNGVTSELARDEYAILAEEERLARPAFGQPPPPAPPDVSLTRMITPFVWVAIVAIALVGIDLSGRLSIGALLHHYAGLDTVAVETTKPLIPLPPPVRQVVRISAKSDEDGQVRQYIVNEGRYNAFIEEQMNLILAAKRRTGETIRQNLNDEFLPVRDVMMSGVKSYEQWYYGWSTGYGLFAAALKAYAGALYQGSDSAIKAADDAVMALCERQFVDRVVKPDENGSRVESAVAKSVQRVNEAYMATYRTVDGNLTAMLRQEIPDGMPVTVTPDGTHIAGEMDWTLRSNGLRDILAVVNRNSPIPDVSLGAHLAAGMTAVVLLVAQKSIVGLAAKIAAPILAKVATATAGGISAATVAGLMSGPLAPLVAPTTFVAVAGLAVATDYGLSKLTEAYSRTEFIANTKEAVNRMRDYWVEDTAPKLTAYSNALYDNFVNTIAMTAEHPQ